jgi:hypothetical protein
VRFLQVVEPPLFIALLLLSCIMYSWAFLQLLTQRTLPGAVAPPRITLLALGLCAFKAILGPTVNLIQIPLTLVVIGTVLFAVGSIARKVLQARRLPLAERTSIDRWAVLMIPPISGIGLLSLQLSITDAQINLLINGFVFANIIPAIYMLVQLSLMAVRKQSAR